MRSRFLHIACLLWLPVALFAQGPWHLKVQMPQNGPPRAFEQPDYPTELPDSATARHALSDVLGQMHGQGFLAASIDTLHSRADTLTAILTPGQRYRWQTLRPGNVPDEVVGKANYKSRYFENATLRFEEVRQLQENILKWCENNGFPFATVTLDSFQLTDSLMSASLFLAKGRPIVFDTIARKGNTKLSKAYLEGYLGIKEGRLYDERLVSKISTRLQELGFVEEEKPFFVELAEDQATVHLFLKNKKVSQFNILVGFLPNNEITGRLVITGEAMLHLINPFGTGKQLFLEWKRLQPRTQELEVKLLYPYVVGLPFGADLRFELYKKDTLYLDLIRDFGVQYHFIGNDYFKGFVNNQTTILLNVDTAQIKSSRSLPAHVDVSNTLYGVEYNRERLNYRLNPTSGYSLKIMGGAGRRKIAKNNSITKIQDPENPAGTLERLYDSLELKTVHYRARLAVSKFWRLSRRSTIKTALTGGAIISDRLFENELFRLGGTQLLRGFDEESIFASLYNVLTLEYRFLLGQNAYFSLFGDGAYVQDRSWGEFEADFPFGFGAGVAFETKAGIFALSYALGRQQQNPIEFRTAKIHFGYVNYF